MSEFNRIIEIKTPRKNRICEWCNHPIGINRCFQVAQVFDGDFHSFYMHSECRVAFEETDNEILDDGWIRGDFERGKAGII